MLDQDLIQALNNLLKGNLTRQQAKLTNLFKNLRTFNSEKQQIYRNGRNDNKNNIYFPTFKKFIIN